MYLKHKILDFIDNIRLIRRDILLMGYDYIVFKFRYLNLLIRSTKIYRFLLTIIGIIVGIILIYYAIVYLYSQSWAGFISLPPDSKYYHIRTLWDWMELLFIPFALAIIAYFFRKSETKTANEQIQEQNQNNNLNEFYGFIQTIQFDTEINDPEELAVASTMSTARVKSLLPTLDARKKLLLLEFLCDTGLLTKNEPFINLAGLEFLRLKPYRLVLRDINLRSVSFLASELESTTFSGSYLSGSSFYKCKLAFSDFTDTNLEYALLNEADFYSAKLTNVSLIRAHARKANFSNSYMENTTCRDTDFFGANLRAARLNNSYLRWAQLVHANLSNADLTNCNLTEANLMYANLNGADLTNADLTGAIVLKSQLKRAKSIQGAKLENIIDRLGPPIMPNRDEIDNRLSKDFRPPSSSDTLGHSR